MANIKIADTKATIQFDCLGTPTHYRVSESNDFTGAVWTSFVNQDLIIDYPLNEFKSYNLFLQVKSSVMESNIKTVTFDRIDDYVAVNLKVVILNNGISETNINNIPVTLQYDGVPKFFKYALNPTLLEGEVQWDVIEWIDFNSFPEAFYIGGNDGNKIIYILLKDEREVISENNSSIMFYNPAPPVLLDASYENKTVNGLVTITPEYSGIANEYSCEITGYDEIWKTFNSSFDLEILESGVNNYKLILRNQFGISEPVDIQIEYNPPAFDISEVIINNGELDTDSTELSVTFTTLGIESVSQYRISDNEIDLETSEWVDYTSQPLMYSINPQPSGTVSVYLQLKSNLDNISSIVTDSIEYYAPGSSLVKIIGPAGATGDDYMTFEGKTYNYSRISYSTRFDVYDYNSAEKLLDWRIMNDAETINEFGGAGETPGGAMSSAFPEGHPYREAKVWFGDDTKPWLYYGLYVPNGTYKVSFLVSLNDTSSMNAYSRSISVNGVNITLPDIPLSGNTQFVELGNHYISDGKLKFIFGVRNSKVFGFNGITIEKISDHEIIPFNIDTLTINNDNEVKTTTDIPITFTTVGEESVSYYRIAESEKNLSTEEWIPYTSQPVLYDLVTNNFISGSRLYLQLKSNLGNISDVKYKTIIEYEEKVSFSIECTETAEANSLELSIPELKFNKEALISLTADDAHTSHYCTLFNYINNRPYSIDYWFHHNQYEAGDLPYADDTHIGTLPAPGKKMGFTDGCGNTRIMTFDCAIWPNVGNVGEPAVMDMEATIDPNAINQYRFVLTHLLWGDLKPMLEFGCGISQHNVNTPKPETPEGILNGYIEDNAKALTKLERGFKILTRPDGNNTYTDVSLDFPQHLAIVGESAPTVYQFPFSETFNFYKALIQRRFPTSNIITEFVEEIVIPQMTLPKEQRRWLFCGIHRAAEDSIQLVDWLENNLGKSGSDVAWMTTPDEFYEYWFMRKYAKIVKTVIGTTANFDLYIPKGQYFYYPELTFMTNQNISGISNIHDKIKGFSFNGDNMFNINLDTNLVSLAEKYTARFEANQLPIDKQDALYFANQLRADLKTPFLLRIDAVENVPLESLAISGGDVADLLIGETTQLTAVFTPAGTAQTNIEWSVNDEEIATVDSNGLVTCVGAGELRVTVQSLDNPAIHAEKEILCVASRPITGIAISGNVNGVVNDTIQLLTILTPSNTTQTDIIWSTSDNSLADVNQEGLVSLKAEGVVTIRATSASLESIFDEHKISIMAEAVPIISIAVTGTTPLEVGSNAQFTVVYNPTNTTERGIVWTSSNKSVATVDSNGLVTAVGVGNATITASSIDRPIVLGNKEVIVNAQVIAITGLEITGDINVDSGNTLQLGINYTPSNTTQQGVTWSSSDETKATVDSNGLVTAIAEGDVVITATSTVNGAISDTHNITINMQPYPEINMIGLQAKNPPVQLYEGKYYQVCNTDGAYNSSQAKKLYDTNTNNELVGWNIMNATEKIAAFGAEGDKFSGNTSAPDFATTPYKDAQYLGGYQVAKNAYYGFNIPNGTYRIKFLFSIGTTGQNWGLMTDNGSITINGTAFNIDGIIAFNNTAWSTEQDFVVSDGMLKFIFSTLNNKYLSCFAGINIKKIA